MENATEENNPNPHKKVRLAYGPYIAGHLIRWSLQKECVHPLKSINAIPRTSNAKITCDFICGVCLKRVRLPRCK